MTDRPWVVLRIKSYVRAALNVRRQGYEWYSPRGKFRSPRTRLLREEPLFPGYAFARHPAGQWVSLRGTFGVAGVMMAAEETPAYVPAAEIGAWMSHEGSDGLVRLEASEFKVGEHVRVERDAMTIDAIVDGMASHDRIYVLLGMLGGARAEVDVRDVVRG